MSPAPAPSLSPQEDAGAEAPAARLDFWCGAAAFFVPLVMTLLRAAPAPLWRDDLAAVRGLGFVPVGAEGVVSSTFMQLAALMPLGGRLLRAAVVSAFGAAVASALLYALARRVLRANAATPRLTVALALAAALSAALAPTWQQEATVVGGATIAAALALVGFLLRPRSSVSDARVWLGYGALIGLTLAENHAAGLALLAALVAQAAVLADLPPRRSLALFTLGLVSAGAICLAPTLVRPLATRAWIDLGYDLVSAGGLSTDTAASMVTAPDAWLGEVGVVTVGIALGGGLWGLARARTRWLVAPLVVLVAADALFPASRGGVLAADPLASVRLLAVAALGIMATLGVHTAVIALDKARIPMAKPAAVLLVVFNFTLVFATSEDGAHVTHRQRYSGAEVWTDEALGSLPTGSLLLVRSPAVAWRLWGARVVRGERPDLVVVPVPLLSHGSVARRLLELEPALAPLIREIAINGQPNEFALSGLADVRPLYVELDPAWDRRLVDHLTPEPLWLSFAPHALGRSDRNASLKRGRRAFTRVLDAAKQSGRDPATMAILQARAREQAYTLAALGDRGSATRVLHDLRGIDPEDAFVLGLQKRMKDDPRGRVDVTGLFD